MSNYRSDMSNFNLSKTLKNIFCSSLYAAAILALLPATSHADLYKRFSGALVYDSDLNITWAADTNMGGLLTWSEANTWADNLMYLGFDDWRLPSAEDLSTGLLCGGTVDHPTAPCISEIGHLFLELGGYTGDVTLADLGLDDGDPFQNVQVGYWLVEAYPTCVSAAGWFRFLDQPVYGDAGNQGCLAMGQHWGTWAVRDGDVIPHYSCVGFEPPMDMPVTARNKNRVAPLKMTLVDEFGLEITDLDVIASPVVEIDFTGGEPTDPPGEDLIFAGQGDDGNQFVYSDEMWRFNLKTKNLSGAGTYTITAVPGDPEEYWIDPTCTATFIIQ